MNINSCNKSMWSLGILAVTVVCAIGDVIADARRRKHAKRQVIEQIHEWENEGGAPLPPPAGHA